MDSSPVPVKTAAGQEELARRTRRLGQRHRTLLLLVDGRRPAALVLQMAQAAGVPAEVFDELLSLGLVAFAEPAEGSAADLPNLLPGADDSMLPASRSLLPETENAELGEPLFGEPPPEAASDAQLEEAREMLLRAVRSEAPVAGSLTLIKLRRAATRDELAALIDEVEQRIRNPRKQLMNAQLLRQVRHLLSLPA